MGRVVLTGLVRDRDCTESDDDLVQRVHSSTAGGAASGGGRSRMAFSIAASKWFSSASLNSIISSG